MKIQRFSNFPSNNSGGTAGSRFQMNRPRNAGFDPGHNRADISPQSNRPVFEGALEFNFNGLKKARNTDIQPVDMERQGKVPAFVPNSETSAYPEMGVGSMLTSTTTAPFCLARSGNPAAG